MIQPDKTERIIAAVGVSLILALAGDLTLYAVFPVVAVSAGIQLSQIGILLSANRFIRFISNPIMGYLLHSSRRKGFLVGGLSLGAFSTLMYQFYDSFWLFLIGRILWGLAFSISYITAYALVMDVTTEERRGRDLGLFQSFYMIGFAITPLLGALLNNVAGFRVTMLACSLAGFAGAAIALFFIPETSQYWRDNSIPGEQVNFPENSRPPNLIQILGEFKQYKIISANLIYALTFFVGDGLLLSTISYYFLKNYGAEINMGFILVPAATAGGIVLTLRASASALLAPLAGHISDRSKNWWWIISFGALIGMVGLLIITSTRIPSIFVIGIILFAANAAIIPSVIPAIISDKMKGGQTTFKLGILATTADIGLALAPVVSYAFLINHSIVSFYFWGAGLLAISLVLAFIAAKVDKFQGKVD